jgi:hypothetical protein
MVGPAIRSALATALLAGAATATGAVAAPPSGHGHGHGHGALKAALQSTVTLLPTQCAAATNGAPKGFAVLNAPGAPGGAPTRVIGTVSLTGAPEKNTAFEVDLATGGICADTGAVLKTNSAGNGTAHFDLPLPNNTHSEFYVVLKKAPTAQLSRLPFGVEVYGSRPVPLS